MAARVELQGKWPPHAPRGGCHLTRIDDPIDGPRLQIDHADPRVTISAELLGEIEDAQARDMAFPGVSLRDGVLRIEAINRTVIYRIGEYLAPIHAYAAEWPD
jgi:hypothetical protein